MKRFLTRHIPIYTQAIIYMLQRSEYNLKAFWQWYFRVDDWRGVMYRGHLVTTPAATVLVTIFALLQIALYAYIPYAWLTVERLSLPSQLFFYAYLLLWAYAAPILATTILTAVIFLAKHTVYRPYVWWRLYEARRILSSHRAVRIAIAGSYGKTSMKDILARVLSEAKIVAATPGNMNTPIAISRFARQLQGDEDVLIVEFGEYRRGDIKKFCELTRPHVGIITGVNEAHLENFGSLTATLETVFAMENFVGAEDLYVNGENELTRDRAKSAQLYNRKGVSGWIAHDATTSLDGTKFLLVSNKHKINVTSKLLGLHQIGPLALAAKLAVDFGLSDEQIEQALGQIEPSPGRLEPKVMGSNVVLLNDTYNGNPDGVRAALEFFSQLEAKRKVYVTPGLVEMGNRTRDVHREFGRELAAAGIDIIYLMDNSVTVYIAEGLEENHFTGELHWVSEPREFYETIDLITKAGDVVLMQNDWPDNYA